MAILQDELRSTFRHHPSKSNLRGQEDHTGVHWEMEPVVTAHRSIKYFNQKRQEDILVPIHATPAIIADIGLVVASDEGLLRFMAPKLDRIYWERQLYCTVYASLVVDPLRKRVIVATTKGRVISFNLKGQIEWQTDLEGPIFATPAICPAYDLLSVAAFGNHGYGLSLENGEIQYSISLPAPWHAPYQSLPSARNPYSSPAVTSSGKTIFCSGNHVLCVGPTGLLIWEKELGAEIKSSPVIHKESNQVAVAAVNGSLVFLDLTNGDQTRVHRLDEKITSSGAVSGAHLAIGTSRGKVHCFHFHSHELLWTKDFGGPFDYTSFTLTPNGDFVATNWEGNISCLSAADGRFLWETSQVLGLDDHEPELNITPILGGDGRMYGASYRGDLYQFSFNSHGK